MSDPSPTRRHDDATSDDVQRDLDNSNITTQPSGNGSNSHGSGNTNPPTVAWSTNAAWSWPSDLPEAVTPVEIHRQSPPRRRPSSTTALPHYHRQLPPLSHSNPIASLTAALRGEPFNEPSTDHYHQTGEQITTQTAQRGQQFTTQTAQRGQQSFTQPPRLHHSSNAMSPDQRNSVNTLNHHLTSNNPSSSRHAALQSPFISMSASANNPSPDARRYGINTLNTRKRSGDTLNDPSRPKRRPKSSQTAVQVDLTSDDEDDPPTVDQALLDREREELIQRQKEESDKPRRLNDLNCMICLEHFTNMSVTHCGHIFCHECLIRALDVSENQSADHNLALCPACRKVIKRNATAKNQIIPLVLMKRQSPRKNKT